MLVPLTRQKFEQLILALPPVLSTVITGESSQVFLNRLLISVVSVVVVWLWHLFWRRVPDVVFFRGTGRGSLLAVGSSRASLRNGNTANTSTAASSVVEYWMYYRRINWHRRNGQ